jgi:hypothetical protein
LKPAGQIVRETLSQKNPSQKRTNGVAQGIGHDLKHHKCKKKKKKKKERKKEKDGKCYIYLTIIKI